MIPLPWDTWSSHIHRHGQENGGGCQGPGRETSESLITGRGGPALSDGSVLEVDGDDVCTT